MKWIILLFSLNAHADFNLLVDRFVLESEINPINCLTFQASVKTKDACELVDNPGTDDCVQVPIAPCELLQVDFSSPVQTLTIDHENLVQNNHDAVPVYPTITSSDFQKVIVTDDFGIPGQVLQSSGSTVAQAWTPYKFPTVDGTINQILVTDGAGTLTFTTSTAVGGDVDGPVSSTDNAIVRFNGTTGKIIQNSLWTISDSGLMSVAANFGSIFQTGTASTQFDFDTVSPGNNADWRLGRFSNVTDLQFTIHDPGSPNERLRVDTNGVKISNAYTMPTADGSSGQAMTTDGAGTLSFSNVPAGPGVSQDNGMVRFDGTGGAIQDSQNFVTDTGLIDINLTGDGVAIQIDAPAGIAGKSSISFQANRGSVGYDSHLTFTTSDTSKDFRFIGDTNTTNRLAMNIDLGDNVTYLAGSNVNANGAIGQLHSGFFGLTNSNVFTPNTNDPDYALLHGASGETFINASDGQNMDFRIGNNGVQKMRIQAKGVSKVVETGDVANRVYGMFGCKITNIGDAFVAEYTEMCQIWLDTPVDCGTGCTVVDFKNGFFKAAPVCTVTSSVVNTDHFCIFRPRTNSLDNRRVQCLDNNNNEAPRDEHFYILCYGRTQN